MKKKVIIKRNDILEYLIGFLLLVPLFIFIVPFQKDYSNNLVIFPLTIYIPILIGLLLSRKFYYEKSRTCLSKMFILTILSFVCFFSLNVADFGDYSTMNMWFVFAFINKLLALKTFYNIAGKKKLIHFIIVLILLILFLYLTSFDLG